MNGGRIPNLNNFIKCDLLQNVNSKLPFCSLSNGNLLRQSSVPICQKHDDLIIEIPTVQLMRDRRTANCHSDQHFLRLDPISKLR
jgi:hypothetical protein